MVSGESSINQQTPARMFESVLVFRFKNNGQQLAWPCQFCFRENLMLGSGELKSHVW